MKTLLEKEIVKLRYTPIIDYDITKNGSLKSVLMNERESILNEYDSHLSDPALFLQFGTINDIMDWLRDMTLKVLRFNLIINPQYYTTILRKGEVSYDKVKVVWYDHNGTKNKNITKTFGRVGENIKLDYFNRRNLDVLVSPNKRTNIKFICVLSLLKKYNINLVILIK